MKKILLMAAAAMLCLASCSKQEKADAQATAEETTTTEVAAAETTAAEIAPGTVADYNDDTTFRPGMKVDQLTILDFNATWCGPCKQLHPVFVEAAKTFSDVRFVSIDIDKLPQTAQAFGVEAVPTVVFLKPDGTSQTFVGTQDLLPADKFDKLVRDNK